MRPAAQQARSPHTSREIETAELHAFFQSTDERLGPERSGLDASQRAGMVGASSALIPVPCPARKPTEGEGVPRDHRRTTMVRNRKRTDTI